jgi:hypothetical protein
MSWLEVFISFILPLVLLFVLLAVDWPKDAWSKSFLAQAPEA